MLFSKYCSEYENAPKCIDLFCGAGGLTLGFTEKRRRYPCSAGTVSTLGCFLSRLSRGFSAQFDIYFQSGIRAWDYPKIAACPDTGCAC